jgi:hypothetical protein
MALNTNNRLDWIGLPGKKTLSVSLKFVNYDRKIFYNIGAWGQCYKTFYVCDLRIFVISISVYQTRPEKLTNDKHPRLLQKSIFYGRNKCYNTPML